MANRIFTLIMGTYLLALGIAGCIPQLLYQPHPMDDLYSHDMLFNYGILFNVFPMNLLLAILLMGFGITGIISAAQVQRSRVYERVAFCVSLVFLFLSFMPLGIAKVWGLLPLFGFNMAIWLGVAMFSFYFAFVDGPLMPSINQPVRHA